MKLNKIKNTKQNLIFGIVLKLFQILLSFAFRSVIVYTLGVQYLGLNSLFSSVLQVLNLAELGVGSAMVFSMYKPIAEDDSDRICALMQLYRIYYRIIGSIILVVGLLLTPAIPKLINGDVPNNINIYVLYLLNLCATVLTYWLFAYKNSVLQAHQQQAVISKVTLTTDAIKYFFQLIALVIFQNYYYYVFSLLLSQALCNILTAIISHRMYPQYRAKGKLPKDEQRTINRRILDLFTSKLGGVIVHSADTIVISAFLGLNLLAMYQNYFNLISAVMSFITILNTSVLAGIGNSMLTKGRKENYTEFKTFLFIEFWILGFCSCCFSSLFQPFMALWMGTDLMLDYSTVILFCVYFLGYKFVMAMSVYKDATGIWHEDRFRPLIASLINLCLNIVLVQVAGINGIILSSIVSVFLISAPWITHNIFRLIFKEEKLLLFLRDIAYYLLATVIAAVLTNILCGLIPDTGIISFVFKLIISVVASNSLLLLILRKHPCFKECIHLVKRMFLQRSRK